VPSCLRGHPELNDARSAEYTVQTRDASEVAAAHVGVGIPEVDVVEDVEEFRAELNAHDRCVFVKLCAELWGRHCDV
jgi:hypothetical protein